MEHIPFNETQIVDSRLFHVDVCGLKGVSNKIDTTVRINVVKTTSDYAIDFYSGFSDNFLSFAFNLNKEIAPWLVGSSVDHIMHKSELLLPTYTASLHFHWDEILYHHKDIAALYSLTDQECELLDLYINICHQYRSWFSKRELAFSISDEYRIPGFASDEAYINAYLEHADNNTLFCFGICDYLPENDKEFLSVPYQIDDHIDLFQSPFYLLKYVKEFWDDQIKKGLSWNFIKHQIHARSREKSSTITIQI